MSRQATSKAVKFSRDHSCASPQSIADQTVQGREDGVDTNQAAYDCCDDKADADVVVFVIEKIIDHVNLLI